MIRIVDNTHLLDATEIFRKLNVHKKVRFERPLARRREARGRCTDRALLGIIH